MFPVDFMMATWCQYHLRPHGASPPVFNEGRNTNIDREIPELPQISNRTILVKYTHTFNL
ncbi:hypothetical protein ES708_17371 [subsurface metagenome]